MDLLGNLKAQYRQGSNLLKLIYVNAAVFLFFVILKIVTFLFKAGDLESVLLGYLAAPASFDKLILRPWTVFTYMFLHVEFFHLLFNMLWLWWFGKIFVDYFDQKRLVSVYILGGLSGALLYIISFNLFPGFSDLIHVSIALGASAAVMAIVVATAVYVPDYTIYLLFIGPVKIKWVALVIFLMTSLVDFSVNSGGKIAHIGGALLGYLYSASYRSGKDITRGINRFFDSVVTWFKPKPKMKVTYKKPMNDFEYNKAKKDHQEHINRILEKISKGGYDSLTKEEKEILFKESQKKN
jgi:membrane associated rhomboid family serine protease